MKKQVLIAFGGNLGDVASSFRFAVARLSEVAKITAQSPLYRTKPVGGPTGQPDYLNAVMAIQTDLHAKPLLDVLMRIEAERGRIRQEHWGARTLDLDMLDYNGEINDTEALMTPHPRMWERAFVLVPLAQIMPDYIHPTLGKQVMERLKELDVLDVVLDDEHHW